MQGTGDGAVRPAPRPPAGRTRKLAGSEPAKPCCVHHAKHSGTAGARFVQGHDRTGLAILRRERSKPPRMTGGIIPDRGPRSPPARGDLPLDKTEEPNQTQSHYQPKEERKA